MQSPSVQSKPTNTLLEVREGLATKDQSSAELIDKSISGIEADQAGINAFVFVAADSAASEAVESDKRIVSGAARPLEGIPIAIKDDTAVAGMPTSEGTAMVAPTVETVDAHLVARLRQAGAIVVGKTNLPEFGMIAVTEGSPYGATRNPYNTDHAAGGSSGGSAAAVAAGLVPAAHGCDGGGSLRIPASCCGLFTIKPSRGRISVAPFGSESPLTCHGFLTHTVADNALLLDIAQGSIAGDANWAPYAPESFSTAVRNAKSLRKLRIAWTSTPPMEVPVDARCADSVEQMAKVCESLGHDVEEFTPEWMDANSQADFTTVWATFGGSFIEMLESVGGDISKVNAHNRALAELGGRTSATEYIKTWARLRKVVRRMIPTWETYDVVLTPTLAQLPLPVGALFTDPQDPMSVMDKTFRFNPYLAIVNVTGQPAASIPRFMYDGLPVGVQAIGRMGDEITLLQLSQQIEELLTN